MIEKRTDTVWIRIGVDELPPLDEVSSFVRRNHCGALNIFQGITRNHDQGKSVSLLFYDSYDEMAISETDKIISEIQEEFPVGAAAVFHKKGEVPVGQASMIVAVSTPHRNESVQATLEIIRRIKQNVPVWKKEYLDDQGEGEIRWKEEPG